MKINEKSGETKPHPCSVLLFSSSSRFLTGHKGDDSVIFHDSCWWVERLFVIPCHMQCSFITHSIEICKKGDGWKEKGENDCKIRGPIYNFIRSSLKTSTFIQAHQAMTNLIMPQHIWIINKRVFTITPLSSGRGGNSIVNTCTENNAFSLNFQASLICNHHTHCIYTVQITCVYPRR